MELGRLYLDAILTEREWSWTVVGMVYLIGSLLIRQVFFRRLIRELKTLDPPLYGAARGLYLKHSLAGWLTYLFSFVAALAAWRGGLNLSSEEVLTPLFGSLSLFLYLLSVIFHLQAFAKGLLGIVQQKIGTEREL